MNLRTLDEFQPLLDLKQPNVVCLPEEEFFSRLEELSATATPTTLISHCMDQVSGFQHYDKIELLNKLAEQRPHLTFVIISVNQLDLCKEVVYYYFPEYHAIYWPLYESRTPLHSKITHTFLSLNKRGDPWRQLLYKKFWKDDLLDKSYFSYLCEDTTGSGFGDHGTLYHMPTWEANRKWADEDFIPKFMPELDGPWPDKCIELDSDSLLDKYKSGDFDISVSTDPTWDIDDNLIATSYCSVIIETDIGNDLVNISEKTIRALALGHPLLVLGASGTHDYLKALGFDLLDDVFDNSFDREPETYARFCKFLSSIDKVATSELQDVRQRCLANRQRVKELNVEMHSRAREIVQSVFQRLNM